jgi:hypothetical protein
MATFRGLFDFPDLLANKLERSSPSNSLEIEPSNKEREDKEGEDEDA